MKNLIKTLVLSLLLPLGAAAQQTLTIPAQTITVPSQTFTTTLTINGTPVTLTITPPAQTVSVPAQTVSLPASGAAALPAGMSYSATTGLTVTGGVTASGPVSGSTLSATSGTALSTCASGFAYFAQNATTGVLTPTCYVAPTFSVPPVTVSQAASPINTITVTP